MLLKDGKMIRLNDDYEPDFRKTIETSIRNAMFDDSRFGFTYANTKTLIDKITNSVLNAISDFEELAEGCDKTES